MTKHEFVEYVKNHKKEIALGTLGIIGTGVLVALGVKGLNSCKGTENVFETISDGIDDNWADKNVVEGFTTGKVNSLWNEGGKYGTAIVNGFKIKGMGALGEDLKKIAGITDDTNVDAVLGFDVTFLGI